MKRNLTVAVFCLVAGIILLANSPTQAQSRTPWADSLRRAALSPNEPSLQHILDSLGYDINVATDELGKELFCGKGGLNTATMVIEVAGSAVYAMSGYYKKNDTSTFYQLFGPSAGPGDSVTFTFSSFDSIGFYMKPNLPGDPHTWLTQNSLNADGFNHAKVFSTGVLHEYLIAWEDLPNGGDQDWNDLVVKINFKNFAPQIHLCGHLDDTPDENSTACDTSIVQCSPQPVCINITAYDPNCQGDSITVTKISGTGTFAAVKGFRNLSTQHCFTPAGAGTYTFVFKVTDQLGASDQDTIHIIVTQGTKPTVVVRDTTLFLCSPSQVCLPISITDPNCDITSVTSNLGSYSGTASGFDQVQRLVQLGGTVTQVGGGQPGKVLTVGSDFVAPVNTQSGVSVTLPYFAFASTVVDAGSFTTGVGPTNSATQLLGAPTNLT